MRRQTRDLAASLPLSNAKAGPVLIGTESIKVTAWLYSSRARSESVVTFASSGPGWGPVPSGGPVRLTLLDFPPNAIDQLRRRCADGL